METVTSRIFSAFCVGGNTSGCIYNDTPDSDFKWGFFGFFLGSGSYQATDVF